MKQQTLAVSGFDQYSMTTRRAVFLSQMDQVDPWPLLCKQVEQVEPVYPKAGNGRPPKELEQMLRIYLLQQWFNLPDPATEVLRRHAPQAFDFTNQRYRFRGVVDEVVRAKNRTKSKVRARVEHVFAVIKLRFGFTKVRYRGLEKNAPRLFITCALANLFMARGHLMRLQQA